MRSAGPLHVIHKFLDCVEPGILRCLDALVERVSRVCSGWLAKFCPSLPRLGCACPCQVRALWRLRHFNIGNFSCLAALVFPTFSLCGSCEISRSGLLLVQLHVNAFDARMCFVGRASRCLNLFGLVLRQRSANIVHRLGISRGEHCSPFRLATLARNALRAVSQTLLTV